MAEKSPLENASVKRVRAALADTGLGERVIALDATARTAEDAAAACGCPLGAIVKSLVFAVGNRMVLALVAGDHRCLEENLPATLFLSGKVRRPQASEVKGATGFTIGGVAPLGLAHRLPTAIDASLKRFETVYAAAGHPHCVFAARFDELAALTGGIVSRNVAAPLDATAGTAPATAAAPPPRRSRTFRGEGPGAAYLRKPG